MTHFRAHDAAFDERARSALEALARCPGYLQGSVGRSTDAVDNWVLVTQWQNVGSYRRALGAFDVKLHATPLLAEALDLPSSFETLIEVSAGGTGHVRESDHG